MDKIQEEICGLFKTVQRGLRIDLIAKYIYCQANCKGISATRFINSPECKSLAVYNQKAGRCPENTRITFLKLVRDEVRDPKKSRLVHSECSGRVLEHPTVFTYRRVSERKYGKTQPSSVGRKNRYTIS